MHGLALLVALIVSPVFTLDKIADLHRLLQDHHKLFCQVYGKWAVTVNYHMSPDMIMDLGPPQSFWCFGYERINGILAGMPNSRRNIEVEVANRFISDICFSNCEISSRYSSSIPSILRDYADTDDDDIHPHYPQSFLLLLLLHRTPGSRLETQMALDRGDVEDWPLELKHPRKVNVKIDATFHTELHAFFEDLYGSDLQFVPLRISKYGRFN